MKRQKLTLDKLVIGSLSDAEQANILGGDDDGDASRVTANTVCVGGSTPGSGKSTDVTHGCPVNPPPKPSTGMTCPANSTTKKP